MNVFLGEFSKVCTCMYMFARVCGEEFDLVSRWDSCNFAPPFPQDQPCSCLREYLSRNHKHSMSTWGERHHALSVCVHKLEAELQGDTGGTRCQCK